jgi:rhomboid protease GluP
MAVDLLSRQAADYRADEPSCNLTEYERSVRNLPSMMNHEANIGTDRIPIAAGSHTQLESLSLVLEAVGIEYWHDQHSGQLLVAAKDAQAARCHLDNYRRENRDWPPSPPSIQPLSPRSQPTLLAIIALALFYSKTGPWSTANNWFIQGAIDSNAVLLHGEWWRLFTALSLHANLAHLLGNCLIGGPIIYLLGSMIGYGQSWLLLLLSGAIGNFCNILIRQHPHLSVGFSTSVFAAIGLFTGLQLARTTRRSLKAVLLPLGAGAGLLTFLGTEGGQTDLGAHLFGFVNGVAFGWMGWRAGLIERLYAPKHQAGLFVLATFLLLAAWVWALH